MPFIKKRKPGLPTLGVFVPCDPRIDEESRTRAFTIGVRTARLLADRLRLPDGTAPNVFYASRLVDSETDRRRGRPGAAGRRGGRPLHRPRHLVLPRQDGHGPDRPFRRRRPRWPASAATTRPSPGVVGIDALVGAYAQTGRLCPMVIGTMPETGLDPEYDAKTKDEIVDLAYAVLTARRPARQALPLRRHRLHADGDRPQPRPRRPPLLRPGDRRANR